MAGSSSTRARRAGTTGRGAPPSASSRCVRGQAGLLAAGDQPQRPQAGRADGDVPLGGRSGGLSRARRQGAAHRRGRRAPPRSVGLRALLPRHVIVGAGDAPCLVLAVGARDRSTGPDWGGYTVDEAALRPGAGVEQETTDPKQAYARFTKRWTRAPAGAAPSAMPWRGFAAGLARSRRLWLSALRR